MLGVLADRGLLKGKRIAVPGKLTTAYLTMRLIEPDSGQIRFEGRELVATWVAADPVTGLTLLKIPPGVARGAGRAVAEHRHQRHDA